MKSFLKKHIILIPILIFTASCEKKLFDDDVYYNGYIPDDILLKTLIINKSDKEFVKKFIGKPYYYDNIIGDKWIYHNVGYKKYAFFEPKIFREELLILSFKDDILKDIYHNKNVKRNNNHIVLSDDISPTIGKELKATEQIIQNLTSGAPTPLK